ncbi:uncharacterized protein LOC116065704 [Sander lucioperca]|uniref:uncharacterized protein LOC116065704 n=1 Tax=Sander lucioperca TaxID=283035 RepID=UPI00125E7D6E|nr:uncharacterized protein LOC116065704 [Sander lucioperca]
MSGHRFFHPPIPSILRHHSCPSCHHSLIMQPKKATLYPAEDELVSLSTVYDLLDEQQHYYKELIQQQERNYRAFLQMLMDSSSSRMDSLVREMQDLRNCLQRTKAELAEVKKQGVQNSKRAECLAEGLVMVRGALDGLSVKSGVIGGGTGGRGVDLMQCRGGGGLRLDGGGRGGGGRGGEAKKTAPKAVKLVADLTDIHFDDIKVVHRCTIRVKCMG